MALSVLPSRTRVEMWIEPQPSISPASHAASGLVSGSDGTLMRSCPVMGLGTALAYQRRPQLRHSITVVTGSNAMRCDWQRHSELAVRYISPAAGGMVGLPLIGLMVITPSA
jgi:hypothetical protein